MIKKHKNRIQQNQQTTENEIEKEINDTEKEIEKKHEEVEKEVNNTQKEVQKKHEQKQKYEIVLVPGKGKEYNPPNKITDDLIKSSKKKIQTQVYNKNTKADEQAIEKTNKRLVELREWEQQQKSECTALLVDEYSIQTAQLSVLETTISKLEYKIKHLTDEIEKNEELIDPDKSPNKYMRSYEKYGLTDRLTDCGSTDAKWLRDIDTPQGIRVKNNLFKGIFSTIDRILKINENNIHDIVFMTSLYKYLDDQKKVTNQDPDEPDETYDIISITRNNFASSLMEYIFPSCFADGYINLKYCDEEFKKDISKLSVHGVKSKMKDLSKKAVKHMNNSGIYFNDCPYDWLKEYEIDKNLLTQKRQDILKVNDKIVKDKEKRDKLKKELENKKDERYKLSKKIRDISNEKIKKQVYYNYNNYNNNNDSDRQNKLRYIKTLSSENAYEKLYNQIKNS